MDTNVGSGSEFINASTPPSYKEVTASAPALSTPNAASGDDEPTSINTAKPYSIQDETVQQPVVLTTEQPKYSFGPYSITIRCPACGAEGKSRITSSPSTASYILNSLLCVLGCGITILLALCNANSNSTSRVCDDICNCSCCNCCYTITKHYCKSCNKFLGSYTEKL